MRAYKGIPFAKPPVGDLRWCAPRTAELWTGTLVAEKVIEKSADSPGPGFAPLQSRTDSEVILPAAMAGGNTGLVLCQVGGQ